MLGFGRTYIFSSLVEVAFRCLGGVGIVLVDIVRREERPAREVACIDRFEPGGLDRIAAHGVHPFDALLDGGQVVDAVGLAESCSCLLGRPPRLPLPSLLHQGDTIPTMLITHTYEERIALTCDQDVLFFVHCDAILGDDGDSPCAGGEPHAHQGMWEVAEQIGLCGCCWELVEREMRDVDAMTGVPIGYPDLLG